MPGRAPRFVAAALGVFALAWHSPCRADEPVRFPVGGGLNIQGYLARPKGPGSFPAVVLLHSCLGLPADRASIAAALTTWGYVALFVDDFSSRGLKETCAVDFPAGLADAFGALRYLATLPYVDPARIGVVGYSQGADTALKAAAPRFSSAFATPDGPAFKAAAAYYPPCANLGDAALRLPTLILIGGADRVTPEIDCERLAQAQPGAANVQVVAYPGAHHCFDDPSFAHGTEFMGMHLEYDRTAARRARSALRAFLAARLSR